MWALIPVKDLRASKSRLAGRLPDYARQSLMGALLADLLAELRQSTSIERLFVVTCCETAGKLASSHGAEVLSLTEDRCLNSGVRAAVQHVTILGASQVMILHGDLPLLAHDDIDTLIAAHTSSDKPVTLVPDNLHAGTNVLLLDLPSPMTFHYGTDSYRHHLAACTTADLAVHTVENLHAGCDIDLWHDFKPLLASQSANTRKRVHFSHWLEQYGDLFEWSLHATHDDADSTHHANSTHSAAGNSLAIARTTTDAGSAHTDSAQDRRAS